MLAADGAFHSYSQNIRETMRGLKDAYSGLHQESIDVAVDVKKAQNRHKQDHHEVQKDRQCKGKGSAGKSKDKGRRGCPPQRGCRAIATLA